MTAASVTHVSLYFDGGVSLHAAPEPLQVLLEALAEEDLGGAELVLLPSLRAALQDHLRRTSRLGEAMRVAQM